MPRPSLQMARTLLGTYLPVLLMGAVALGSWWLLSNAPPPQDAQAGSSTQRTEPDYFMSNFSVQAYNAENQLNHSLLSTGMVHLPASNTFKLTSPRFLSIDDAGQRLTGHSDQGETNSDGSIIELLGNAHVQRSAQQNAAPTLRFDGPHLRVFAKEKRVESDQNVRLSRGNSVFTGSSLQYDHQSGKASLAGPVRAMLPANGA